MKANPGLKKAEENMRPGVITLDGFLGNDGRSLGEILIADEGAVRLMGLTHRAIAERMRFLMDAGQEGLGEFVSVNPHYEVRVQSVRGKLPCPFGDGEFIPKTNIIVKNLSLGREVTFTEFHIHLVGDHGFYEGQGSPFRMNPEDLRDILEIEPSEGDGL